MSCTENNNNSVDVVRIDDDDDDYDYDYDDDEGIPTIARDMMKEMSSLRQRPSLSSRRGRRFQKKEQQQQQRRQPQDLDPDDRSTASHYRFNRSDTKSWNLLLKEWSSCGLSGDRAERVLRFMMEEQQQKQKQNQKKNQQAVPEDRSSNSDKVPRGNRRLPSSAVAAPDSVTLNTVLAAYAGSSDSSGSSGGSDYYSGGGSGGGDGGSYYNDQQQPSNPPPTREHAAAAAAAARALLRQWREWFRAAVVDTNADVISYNTVLKAHARIGDTRTALEVFDELLHQPQEQQQQHNNNNTMMIRPDQVTYGTLLHAYAVAGQPDQAEALLRQFLRDCNNRNDDGTTTTAIQQDAAAAAAAKAAALSCTYCYNEVLYAYSKAGQSEKAVSFFQWWKDHHNKNKKNRSSSAAAAAAAAAVQPDTRSYNILLYAVAQSKRLGRSEKVRHAKGIFDSIERPDAVSYTTLIAILCDNHCQTAAAGGGDDSVLNRVKDVVAKAWDCPAVRADPASFFTNVLYSLSKCDDEKNMPVFAEQLLRACTLKRLLEPTLDVFNALLHCWSRSKHNAAAGKRAVTILSRLRRDLRYRPDIKTYTNVLAALARSSRSDPDALPAAEEIIRQMEQGGGRQQQRQQRQRQQEDGPSSSGPSLSPPPPLPNVQAYTCLIQNYARSRHPYKAVRAAAVLQRMKDRQLRPTIVSYNAVLNAAEHTVPVESDPIATEEALRAAFATFEEIRSSRQLQATHVTYGAFLGALANLMPFDDARQEIVELVFKRCRLDGQVSPLVLKKLKMAASGGGIMTTKTTTSTTTTTKENNWPATNNRKDHDDVLAGTVLYYKLLQGHAETELPTAWTRNVRQAKARQIQ